MITLPELPYSNNALSPYISEDTLNYHYGKHHKTYADKLNGLIQGTELVDKSLEEIILTTNGAIFNNAAQVWNHSFYWQCLSEKHHQEPTGPLLKAIEDAFGDYASFKETFSTKAAGIFGSGWCWLVLNPEDFSLQILETSNAETPLTKALIPLLTCDVWEHAYYLDTQNQRPKYIENYWNIVNWEFVSNQFIHHTGTKHDG